MIDVPALSGTVHSNMRDDDDDDGFRDPMADLFRKLRRLNEDLGVAMPPAIRRMNELSRSLVDEMSPLLLGLSRWAEEFHTNLPGNFLTGLPTLKTALEGIDFERLRELAEEAHDEGEEDNSWAAEVKTTLEEAAEEASDVRHFLYLLAERIRGAKSRMAAVTLLKILGAILATWILSFVGAHAVNKYEGMRSMGSVAQVEKQIRSADPDGRVSPLLRIVGLDRLKLKRGNRARSTVIGALERGEVVLLIERRRNKALVQVSRNDAQLVGWVPSKHLRKIRSKRHHRN